MPPIHKFRIHPPLPLNPRQSKQLLNLLTTSFRKQLDAEHSVTFKTPSSSKPPHLPTTTTQYDHEQTSIGHPRTRSRWHTPHGRPLDRHLMSVLSNPLFTYAPKEADGEDLNQGKDPMDVFDKAVARGLMTLQHAGASLIAKKTQIVQSSVLDVREGMKSSGAGLKVLQWLVSSGTANDSLFLKRDPRFSQILFEFMVAEELQEIAWSWIRKAFEVVPMYGGLDKDERISKRHDVVRPLMMLTKAEVNGNGSLDAAYLVLSRAAGYLKGRPIEEIRWALSPPGKYLIHRTKMMSSGDQAPSEENFDSFLSLVPSIAVNFEKHFAHLYLLHPTKPTAALALSYLRKLKSQAQQDKFVGLKSEGLHLCLDTAKFLLDQDAHKDVEWVVEFLRATYPENTEPLQRRKSEQARAELESLLLLENLSVA